MGNSGLVGGLITLAVAGAVIEKTRPKQKKKKKLTEFEKRYQLV